MSSTANNDPSNLDLEYKNLCLSIAIATTALKGHRVRQATFGKKRLDPVLKSVQHIATLLTTGTPRDTKAPYRDTAASRVVAVTANADPNSKTCRVIVTQNTHTRLSPEKLDVQALEPGPDQVDRDILPNCLSRPHYADILAILDFFRTADGDLSDERVMFHAYVINHAYPKIVARMQVAESLWGWHPIRIIGEYPVEKLSLSFPWKLSLSESVISFLFQQHGSLPERSGSYYLVTKNNIASWIRTIAELYDALEHTLMEDNGSGEVAKRHVTKNDVMNAVTYLGVLHHVLRSRFFDLLLEDPGLSKALETKQTRSQRGSSQLHISQLSAALAAQDINEEQGEEQGQVEEDADDEANASAELGESPGHHIIQYLKTITAWYDAVQFLTRRQNLPYPLDVHLVSLPKPGINVEDMDRCIRVFQESVLVQTPEGNRTAVMAFLTKRVKNSAVLCKPTVHAEAGMMALACLTYSKALKRNMDTASSWYVDQAKEGILKQAFSVHNVAIGASKKCCWCCWKLYTHLQNSNFEGTDENVYPQFSVLGSHSTIFPWYLPEAGVPTAFLQNLLQELMSLVIQAAVDEKNLASRQTSASSSGEYDDDGLTPTVISHAFTKVNEI
ncbi:unnamed protein product [Somion occarium]|uniref:Uncharacterized protein n=1 Tax=Somion occarium TaxID=3059160 RepID=A0ABP1DQF0_9APHY